MEQQQFLHDDTNDMIHLTQEFQVDRFSKKTNNLNIPDTILENCSGELSGDGIKGEASKTITDNFNLDNKENISHCANQRGELLNISMSFLNDNSYIKECERKLLENSNCDDEKYSEFENKTVMKKMLLNVPRKALLNDTISTPPSALRREISFLRNEMAEVHEFHDLEIQLLKEEKCSHDLEPEPDNFAELFEKYSALMELYTTLKTEYDEYRKEQERMRQELQSKTADCLESLCSQIEASDNSLNFSNASFVSFNGGIKSSTMMEDITEVEATVMHDGTILASDPLSISRDSIFKTPMQSLLKSAKKSTMRKPIVKEIGDIMAKKDATIPLDSEYSIQLLNLETALYEKIKEVKDLEQRLFKVEDLCTVLQNEFERITVVHEKETESLKKTLSSKTEQLNELTEKLFTETISLDPSLRNSLIDIPSTKLLVIFIETIMESCKKIQNELIAKHNREKSEWEAKQTKEATSLESLREELEDCRKTCRTLEENLTKAENVILTRDEEIRLLQSHLTNARQKQEDFETTRQTILELEARLTLSEAEKTAAENRYRELEALVRQLERSLEEKEKTRLEEKSEMDKIVESLKTNFAETESKLAIADEYIIQLKKQLQSMELDKTQLENRCNELERLNQNLQNEVVGEKNEISDRLLENEKTIENLRAELELALKGNNQMQELIETLKNENSNYLNALISVEENQKRLSEVLESMAKDTDSPTDRIAQILERETETNETRETKIISIFTETITKTCRGVQGVLTERFEKRKVEWEIQRNEDLNLIENLRTQIQSLNERSKEKEEKIEELNLGKEELMKAHETLKLQMEEAEKIISSCNEQIKDLQSREILEQTKLQKELLEKFESEKVHWESQRNEYLNLIENLRTQVEDLNVRSKEKEEKIEELNLGKEELVKAHETLKSQMEEAEKIILNCNEQIKDLQSRELVEQTKLQKELLEKFESEKVEWETQRNEYLNLIENLRTQIQGLNVRSKEKEEKIEELNLGKEELVKAHETLKSQMEEAEKIILNCNEQIKDLQSRELVEQTKLQKELLEKFESEKVEWETQRNEYLNLIENLRTEVEDLNERSKEKEEKIEEMNMEKEELMKAHETLKSQMEEAEKIISNCNEQIKILQSREVLEQTKLQKELLEKFESEKVEWETQRNEYLNLIENLRTEVEDLNERSKEKEEKIEEINMEKEELMKAHETLKSQMEEAEKIISNCNEQIKALQSREILEQAKLQKELLEKFESEKVDWESQRNDYLNLIENLRTQVEDLNDRSKQKEEKIEEINMEKEELMKAHENLKSQMEEAEKIISNCNEQIKTLQSREVVEQAKLQNELLEKFESEKVEWETQRNEYLNLIENLRTQVEDLNVKSKEKEEKFAELNMEKEELMKAHETLKSQLEEAEKIILNCNEQMKDLQSREILEQTKLQKELLEKFEREKIEWERRKDEDFQNLRHEIEILKSETETVRKQMEKLKEEKENVRVEKLEVDFECRKAKEMASVLQTEIETKETIIKGLGELKLATEAENGLLKQQIVESEEVIVRLKKSLETVKEEQDERDTKISDLVKEMESVKKERESYLSLTVKLETLQKNNKSLAEVLSEWQRHLDMSDDTIAKLLSGEADGRKILSEKLNAFTRAQLEDVNKENKTLRLGNETLKDKVKQLTKLMGESALKDENAVVSNGRTKAGKKIELCLRRLDKLEEVNHNLTELVTWILTATEFPNLEKVKLGSVREFPSVLKKVMAHVNELNGRLKELKEEKAQLDGECETYAKVIKDLEKDAKDMWKANEEKTKALEAEIEKLNKERADLEAVVSKLETECQKLKSAPKTEGSTHNCNCGSESKKINELKRAILVKEQKLLELQDLAAQTNSYKSQIEYLKTALERERKKVSEEKEKNKKLENELNEGKTSQVKKKGEQENEVLEELRMRGSISGGIVQEFVDKEKMKKLSKDIGILKELCRARYAEIKRLEAENAALLKNGASKNSNQLDSPIRSIGHNTRSKTQMKDLRKMEMRGKENSCFENNISVL